MQEKWAIVTGATSGIGWATAKALAQQGFSILALGRREERLQALAVEIQQTSKVQVQKIILDITDRNAVSAWMKENQKYLQLTQVLVNNAGLAKGTEKIQDSQIDDWEEMIDTNIKGLLFMTRGVLEHMVRNNSGHIVNLGSVAGRWTYPGGGVYCATKFAVRALTEGLRMDLLGTQIRVTTIEPGMVNTEFSLVRLGEKSKADQVYAGMKPLSAEDVAETIAWCVARPAHINIQELVIYPTDQAHVGQVARRS